MKLFLRIFIAIKFYESLKLGHKWKTGENNIFLSTYGQIWV